MKRLHLVAALCLCAPLFAACNGSEDDEWTQNEIFQRMQRQPKFKYYQRNDFFEDGRAMRTPPANTLSRENYDAEQVGSGLNPDGTFVETIPMPVDMATLELGKKNFQIVCAACHGLVGDGQSMVAVNMALANPASFHSEKLKSKPDGYIFQVASNGYGLMPPFGWRLTPKERWAVVAYIRALEYSQSAPLAEAPPDVKAKLQQEAQ